mmetsp:Transcript_2210/g.3920  ORF Transcript_2210/g.3920 Transcript_2210/m.3920 type:complete len:83 (-) Transcript_2210:925-1173(-)
MNAFQGTYSPKNNYSVRRLNYVFQMDPLIRLPNSSVMGSQEVMDMAPGSLCVFGFIDLQKQYKAHCDGIFPTLLHMLSKPIG